MCDAEPVKMRNDAGGVFKPEILIELGAIGGDRYAHQFRIRSVDTKREPVRDHAKVIQPRRSIFVACAGKLAHLPVGAL